MSSKHLDLTYVAKQEQRCSHFPKVFRDAQ